MKKIVVVMIEPTFPPAPVNPDITPSDLRETLEKHNIRKFNYCFEHRHRKGWMLLGRVLQWDDSECCAARGLHEDGEDDHDGYGG